jgi:hypothetical protein
MWAVLFFIAGMFVANQALAFDAEGFHSGMSVAEVSAQVSKGGLTLRTLFEPDVFVAGLLKENGEMNVSGPVITFSFCKGSLYFFSHNIDIDADYLPLVSNFIQIYGSVVHVKTDRQPNNGGYIETMYMYWYAQDDRVNISFSPQKRKGVGDLLNSRSVNVSYSARTACIKPENW